MNDMDLRDAKAEAKRFQDRIAEFEVHVKMQAGGHGDHYACPHRAAIRRASMDLTRALAQLRRA